MILKRFIFIVLVCVILSPVFSFAQSDTPVVSALKEEIARSKRLEEATQKIDMLVDIYMQKYRFDELYEYLNSLQKKKIFRKTALLYYYKALARFNQIRFLQENKNWEELFEKKDVFYADIEYALKKINTIKKKNKNIALKAKLFEYKMIKNKEENTFEILEELFSLAQAIVKRKEYQHEVLKDIANELFREGEANYAKKLYNLYIAKIANSDIKHQDLKEMAKDFLQKENIDLAVSLSGAYLDKLIDTHQGKEFIMAEALAIIDIFANTGWQTGKDTFFAEEIFAKIEKVYTSDAFDEETQYRRAYNLEKMKEYKSSMREYMKLINEFSDCQYKDRIYFRIGVLSAYMLGDIDRARIYFLKVINNFKKSPDYLNSAYHLGLLNHWTGDTENALQHYNLILREAKDINEISEIAHLASERIREIENNQDIEYNLRSFLKSIFDSSTKIPSLQLDLFVKNAKEYLGNPITFQVNTYLSSTGCLQQVFTYLWSGQLGSNIHPLTAENLETSYSDIGTKVINVALVDPTGIVKGAIEMVDIYPASPQPPANLVADEKTTGLGMNESKNNSSADVAGSNQ